MGPRGPQGHRGPTFPSSQCSHLARPAQVRTHDISRSAWAANSFGDVCWSRMTVNSATIAADFSTVVRAGAVAGRGKVAKPLWGSECGTDDGDGAMGPTAFTGRPWALTTGTKQQQQHRHTVTGARPRLAPAGVPTPRRHGPTTPQSLRLLLRGRRVQRERGSNAGPGPRRRRTSHPTR
jgi:hypothetical protein